MNFEFSAPSNSRRPRNYKSDHDRLFTAIQSRPGEWVRIEPDGRPLARQAALLINAARLRGLRIQTHRQADAVFLRVRTEEAAALQK